MENVPLVKKHYSGKQIIRAGEYLILEDAHKDQKLFSAAMDVLSFWRFSHEIPLQAASNALEHATLRVEKKPIFAKRLKRQASIVSKLKRFKTMKLKNMQDIGGCRAVVANQKKVYQVVRELKSRIPSFKKGHPLRVKDYIEQPKADGYRGIHVTGHFYDELGDSKSIELQIRTRIQHYWATAVEIVDLYTGQALKSNQGEKEWALFFKLVSEHFSIMEQIHQFERMSLEEKAISYYRALINKTKEIDSLMLIKSLYISLAINVKFEAFQHTLKVVNEYIEEDSQAGYILLEINTLIKEINSTLFNKEQSSIAESLYTESEKNNAGNPFKVVALVSANAVGGVKEAYPNYFADSNNFMELITIIFHAPFQKELIKRPKLAIEM